MEQTLEQQIQSKKEELRKLEADFQNELEKNNPIVQIQNYKDVCNKLKVSDDDNTIKIEIPGFDEDQKKCVMAFIKKMRICEAYNGKKKLGYNEPRHYCWYRKGSSASSGLVFDRSHYNVDGASLDSASRLSFQNNEYLMDFVKKFKQVDEDIIDVR